MNHRSLAFRLAVWYALLLSATFALVGTGMFYGLDQYLRSNLRDSLRRRSAQVEQILAQSAADTTNAAIAGAIDNRIAPEFNNRLVRVTRAPAVLIYRSGLPADHSFDPKAVPLFAGAWPLRNAVRRVAMQNQRLLVSATPLNTASGQYLIEVGTSLDPIDAVQDRLLSLLGLLLPVLVVCAAGGGYLLVNWALRPVDRISRTAEQMSVQHLESRLPVVPTGDALERLSTSLNHMLGRLRDSVQTSRRFLADASHELRTPLTVVKGELQEIVGSDTVQREVRERIGSVLEEVARLEHLVSGLLALSRLDAGEAQREWVDVDLAELAANTAEQMRLMAEDRGIRLDSSALRPMVVRGDRGRLKQVIVNLLDNAIRFTPRGGTVSLLAAKEGGYLLLEVHDTGIGIPSSALPHVFDRFFRVDEARSREDGGGGLGLSIVKSICSAHGAEIEVESRSGYGSCFRLKFPRTSLGAAPGAPPNPRDTAVFVTRIGRPGGASSPASLPAPAPRGDAAADAQLRT
ncbi:MAG: ATP-binding protein [Steroidobacteraceae bacterium]